MVRVHTTTNKNQYKHLNGHMQELPINVLIKYLFDPNLQLQVAKEYNFKNALHEQKIQNLWKNAYWILAQNELQQEDISDD